MLRLKFIGTVAIVVLASMMSASAQNQSSMPNRLERDAPLGPLGRYLLAQQLYAYGESSQNILAVIAAASIVANFAVHDVSRRDGSTGGRVPELHIPPLTGLTSVADMLATARRIAGQTRILGALIEDLEASANKGRVPVLARENATVAARSEDIFPIVFKANEIAEIEVILDDRIPLMLIVVDEFDRQICAQFEPNTLDGHLHFTCRWMPVWTGPFKAIVSNQGKVPVNYLILTN